MRVGIVGGGIAGLTAGYRLCRAGHDVSVFEARADLGGQAGTFLLDADRPDGPRLEYYYHHLFPSDGAAVALIDELGLSSRLAWLTSRMGYFYNGAIYDFVTPLDLLRFRPLPLRSRLVLGLQTLWLQRFGDWRELEQITAREWALKWGGRQVYDVIWGALTRSKFGAYADEISMAWLWGKVVVRRSLKGSGLVKETLGYLLGSFQQLTDSLAAGIRAAGGRIYTATSVDRVRVENHVAAGLLVRQADAVHSHDFDAVILTVPDPVVLGLVPEMPESYAAPLHAMRYQAAQVLVLKMNQALSRIYWLNVPEPAMPMVAAIEHTNYVGPEHYGGAHLLYLSNYLSAEDPRYAWGKEELLAYYTPYVQKINPGFRPDWVQQSWLFRDPYAQPIIGTNYSRQIPEHRTPITGLYLANSTQIYPEDRGLNYTVRLGQAISEIVQGREAHVSERW